MIRFYYPYVEGVNVYKPRTGSGPSLFGKIVFKLYLIPDFLMGDHEKNYFEVEGRPLYCKRFVSDQNTKNAATASTSVADGGNNSGGDE